MLEQILRVYAARIYQHLAQNIVRIGCHLFPTKNVLVADMATHLMLIY